MTPRSAEVGSTIGRIRNPSSYERGQWDLDIFSGCYGDTNIQASDRDGAVERGGCVLLFEFKSPQEKIDRGQDLMYRALARHRAIAVMVIRGPRNVPQEYCFWRRTGPGLWVPCDLNGARAVVTRWFQYADACDADKTKHPVDQCGCLNPGDPGFLEAIPPFDAGLPPTAPDGSVRCSKHGT